MINRLFPRWKMEFLPIISRFSSSFNALSPRFGIYRMQSYSFRAVFRHLSLHSPIFREARAKIGKAAEKPHLLWSLFIGFAFAKVLLLPFPHEILVKLSFRYLGVFALQIITEKMHFAFLASAPAPHIKYGNPYSPGKSSKIRTFRYAGVLR